MSTLADILNEKSTAPAGSTFAEHLNALGGGGAIVEVVPEVAGVVSVTPVVTAQVGVVAVSSSASVVTTQSDTQVKVVTSTNRVEVKAICP